MDYFVKRLENLEREECRIAQIKLVAIKCRIFQEMEMQRHWKS